MRPRHRKRRFPEGTSVEHIACTSKVQHPTEAVARIAAKAGMMKSGGRSTAMWVYRCQFCDGWHITSRPSGLPAVTL